MNDIKSKPKNEPSADIVRLWKNDNHVKFLLIMRKEDYGGDCTTYEDELFPLNPDTGYGPPHFAKIETVVKVSSTTFIPKYVERQQILRDGEGNILWANKEHSIPATQPIGGWTMPKEQEGYASWMAWGYDHEEKQVEWAPNGIGYRGINLDDYPDALECVRKDKMQAYVVTLRTLSDLMECLEEQDLFLSTSWSNRSVAWGDVSRRIDNYYEWENGVECSALFVTRF